MIHRGWMVLALGLLSGGAGAAGARDVQLLASSPACVVERLGQVSVSVGTREPNERTGMRPSAVSYQKAFAGLQQAARDKGGEAVVLRGHEAAFHTKGARESRRPTFLSLQGAVVRLAQDRGDCALEPLDPVAYERDAMGRDRQDVVIDKGVSY